MVWLFKELEIYTDYTRSERGRVGGRERDLEERKKNNKSMPKGRPKRRDLNNSITTAAAL